TTLLLTHPACLAHDTGYGHPEQADRLRAIEGALGAKAFSGLKREEAPLADLAAIERLHPKAYVEAVQAAIPKELHNWLDPDTVVSPGSWEAALRATGAVLRAVDEVAAGKADNAFCAVRPPGHHAEPSRAMGFCLFNSVAVAALHARATHGAERVAVIDFDVHHGNGTVDIFRDRPEVLVCSSFQHPFYPYRLADIVRPNIINTPLDAGTGSAGFRRRISADWLPALERHRPQLILVSAGFDAHREDPLGGLDLDEEDFRWITALIRDAADHYCEGRIVSALEGGYDLDALARSVHAHLQALLD
ncbi:MAG: histone deacetylase family protein, partial [Pseudomonadales bacterium]|nr:histone deacetylase family protein [Pseudomonadales bacterium]